LNAYAKSGSGLVFHDGENEEGPVYGEAVSMADSARDVDLQESGERDGDSCVISGIVRFRTRELYGEEEIIQMRSSLNNQVTEEMRSRNMTSDLRPSISIPEQSFGLFASMISYPSSPYRLLWDLTGACLIFYDLVMIPFTIAFNLEYFTVVDVVDWITLIYWTVNMPATLQVGFVWKGHTVMNFKAICLHYVCSWLVVDLVTVIPDWIFSIAHLSMGGEKNSTSSGVKLLRTLRLLRLVRLLRLLKLKKIFANLNDHIDSEAVSIITNIFKLLFVLININHITACVWFYIGDTSAGDNWIEYHDIVTAPREYQYATSFHWAITQFTPASMDIVPHNMNERVFCVFTVLFALVGFSYLVGSITGSLTQLRMLREDSSKQFWNLRRYLRHCKVPLDLRMRIEKYLEYSWQKKCESVVEEDVVIMKLLSEGLRDELRCAQVIPHLSVHPIFEYISSIMPVTLNRITTKALNTKRLARDDSLFHAGELALNMAFIVEGKLMYMRGLDESCTKGEVWISEPVLWTPNWIHLGALTATSVSELLLVDPEKFGEVVQLNPLAHEMMRAYCIGFLDWLNETERDDLSDIFRAGRDSAAVKHMLPGRTSTTRSIGHMFSNTNFDVQSLARMSLARSTSRQRSSVRNGGRPSYLSRETSF
jgi:hypothetical protein